MCACPTLAALIVAVLAVLAVDVEGTPAAGRPSRRWSPSGGARSSRLDGDDALRAKVDELVQLGVTSDDVVRYIWRMRQSPAAAADSSQLRAALQAAAALTPASAADQRLRSDGHPLLVRQFVRNRTVACNDGSPAG